MQQWLKALSFDRLPAAIASVQVRAHERACGLAVERFYGLLVDRAVSGTSTRPHMRACDR